MKFKVFCIFSSVFLGPNAFAEYTLKEVIGGLKRPIKIVFIDGSPEKFLVAEQQGTIQLVNHGKIAKDPFLDIEDKVTDVSGQDERGLLGLALHPEFSKNGRFFVNYTTQEGPLTTHISEFLFANGKVDPKSEKVLLKYEQPFNNHNGGEVAFGPDGLLYIGSGDGGSGGDPQGNGQDLQTLLGKILRLDVDKPAPHLADDIVSFPQDPQARKEIYAYGLRNPWRFSFDTATGDLWVADVGQNKFEEVDIVERGENYGWNVMEGKHCFKVANCSTTGLKLPIHEYDRNHGASITGGFVYRGSKLPELAGQYIYGDYASGKIWALKAKDKKFLANVDVMEAERNISSFGQDGSGEVYVIDFDGSVLQLVRK